MRYSWHNMVLALVYSCAVARHGTIVGRDIDLAAQKSISLAIVMPYRVTAQVQVRSNTIRTDLCRAIWMHVFGEFFKKDFLKGYISASKVGGAVPSGRGWGTKEIRNFWLHWFLLISHDSSYPKSITIYWFAGIALMRSESVAYVLIFLTNQLILEISGKATGVLLCQTSQ